MSSVWFVDCVACQGQRHPTVFCHECKEVFCDEDYETRHCVGKYLEHHIERISNAIKLNCEDCNAEHSVENLINCKDCKMMRCRVCDVFVHTNQRDHDREIYVVNECNPIFVCTNCSEEERGKTNKMFWCQECKKAYCERDNETRHSVGTYISHKENGSITQIDGNLELICNDCDSPHELNSLVFCGECNAFFCKICDRYAHHPMLKKQNHRRRGYFSVGTIQKLEREKGFAALWAHMRHNHSAKKKRNNEKTEIEANEEAKPQNLQLISNDEQTNFVPEFNSEKSFHLSDSEEEAEAEAEAEAEHSSQNLQQLMTTEELKAYIRILKVGIRVVKHCCKVSSRPVIVNCNNMATEIHWCPTSGAVSLKNPSKRKIHLQDVTEIRYGLDTDPEYQQYCGTPLLRAKGAPENADRSLSIIATNRTVDIEFSDRNACLRSLIGLRSIFNLYHGQHSETLGSESLDANKTGNAESYFWPGDFRTSGRSALFDLEDKILEAEAENSSQNLQLLLNTEELKAYIRILKVGIRAVKHCCKSSSRLVILHCNDMATEIHWSPTSGTVSLKNPSKRKIHLQDVTEIRYGLDTDPEYQQYCGTPLLRAKGAPENADRSLSIIATNRTVDIEFSDRNACLKSLVGLRSIFNLYGVRHPKTLGSEYLDAN